MTVDDGLWHKDAIFYEVHVRAFKDGNDDGIGDFVGLTSQLDYIKELGVDCLWLLPFFKSPLRDDGYDVSDYRAIHPDYGTMADFERFLEAAHARGLRVIADLVMNHTSDQHAWFQAARRLPDSPFRHYYIWSDSDQAYSDARIIFVDAEPSNWSWDPVAKAYYWHRFFHHQPDLNYDNPAVRRPITDIFLHTPEIPPACQWCLFLRNHDELTLEMVSEDERRHLYYAYGEDPRMRLNVGIRRRLAPLLDNDRRKIELLTALLFTLPGSPILYYGDELGMGDNIYLGDRNGVRTPMQWTGDRNAGFSRADTARLFLPLIVDPVYGYQAINIEAQLRTPTSLLKWMKRIIEVRKKTQVFGRGTLRFLRPANESVLAHVRSYEGETVLAVHNLSSAAQPVELDLRPWAGQTPIEMLGESRFPTIGEQPYVISLGPYGYYWFRLQPPLSEQPFYGIEYAPL